MKMNISKIIFCLILFCTMQAFTSGTSGCDKKDDKVNDDQCPYSEDTDEEMFGFKIEIEIEGLSLACTEYRVDELGYALLKYHNAAINCGCRKNNIIYDTINVTKLEIGEGDGGNFGKCDRGIRGRALWPNDNMFNSLVVEYSVKGDCGYGCPRNPFPGGSGWYTSNPYWRHLQSIEENPFADLSSDHLDDFSPRLLTNSKEDAKCFEPLFVKTLKREGFREVTGVDVITVMEEIPETQNQTETAKDCEKKNPCKAGGDQFYFEHTLPHYFIQCDAHGGCYELRCPKGTRWDQDKMACIHKHK